VSGDPQRPTVILLHGLARTHRSLAGLQRHLERAGFPTWSRSYPSRRLSIAAAADEIASSIARDFPDGRPLAAVTHSLGGILIRHLAARLPFTRIVMLAPPSQGSRLARAWRDQPMYRWFYGPAGQEVGAPDGHRAWPKLTAPCAIIAGTHARAAANPTSWITRRGPYFSFGEPNDGTLAVEETRAADMTTFATVPASHTWIMNDERARQIVVRFLQEKP
jgi:pimeloyl-ACP methyl ester carboxylesterase